MAHRLPLVVRVVSLVCLGEVLIQVHSWASSVPGGSSGECRPMPDTSVGGSCLRLLFDCRCLVSCLRWASGSAHLGMCAQGVVPMSLR